MKIEGRTFIISGGVSGLGLATARALHSLGGYVSLLDLNSDNGNAVVSELGQRSRFFETDVTSSDAIAAAIAGTVQPGLSGPELSRPCALSPTRSGGSARWRIGS